ncbi:hypothetical protein Hypma_002353 [Hypsizygus marmoreus]|uniref:Uncharacterized protein n=1 Tax=Hypsizygus marmoreus TaxID=39966 RepID=A0A369JBN4_HYPMA|nr:hypothetical protein Hypma_002353 [Hypsizygus marmoreus]
MKFSLLTALVAGAALVEVGASPIRVMVVTSSAPTEVDVFGHPVPYNKGNMRFGHAVPYNNGNPNVATLVKSVGADGKVRHRTGCRGARLRQKAIEISNTFRQALGLPLIETGSASASVSSRPSHDEHTVHILPFVGTPPTFVETKKEDGKLTEPPRYVAHAHPHPHHIVHNGGRLTKHLERAPFLKRIHFALMALGPWEGRAVAFVLGCGIGVLLRMFWVLAVISYRLIKGTKEDDSNKYTEIMIVEEYDEPEEVFAAPPYTFADEKQADKDATAVAEEAK